MTTLFDPISGNWWAADENDKHSALVGWVRQTRQTQDYRKIDDLLHASLYGNLPLLGFGFNIYSRPLPAATSRLALNVVRNMTNAVVSKIGSKNRPKPTFLTEDGNYDQQQQAQQLEKFISGIFYECGVYRLTPKIFRDCCVFGTGFVKVYENEEGRICIDRIMPWEMVVDDGEAMYATPPNLYHRKYFDRQQLKAVFGDTPEKIALIESCPRDSEDNEFGYESRADQVLVTEGWHLDSTKGAKDGRHVIAIENCTLVDEAYDEPGFPFAVLRWTEPIVGYFGVGLAEELTGVQTEINKLLLEIQRGHHLIKGHYLVENGSKVVSAHINSDLSSIIKYTGTKPEYQVPAIIAPEVYQHLWNLYEKSYEISGISQLSASSQKPQGLNSGVALRAYEDIQTERFIEVGQAFEEFVLDIARLCIRKAKTLAKGKSFKVKTTSKDMMEVIDWADVDLDEEAYVMKVFPTSMLPSTPSGRLQWAQDMIQSGVIPPEDVLEIVDFPDTQAYSKAKLAPRKLIEKRIARILKTADATIGPEPQDNHQLALRLVNEALAQAQLDNMSFDVLECLRNYMVSTVDFMNPPQAPEPQAALGAPPMPPGPMGPPMPPGPPGMPPMPMPPPVSGAIPPGALSS